MSFYKWIAVVAVAVGLCLTCCGKGDRPRAIEAPSSAEQQRIKSRKGEPPLERSPSQNAPAMPEKLPINESSKAEDFFSAAQERQRRKDYKGAIELFERACAEGQNTSCYQLGIMYRDGIGVATNERRAQSWFQHACEIGNIAACDALGH